MMNTRVNALIKILGIFLTMILSLLTLYKSSSGILLGEHEIINVFLTAFFSHLAIIARGFFVPLFLSLSEKYNPVILGLSAGLGGALGETIAYYWGRSIRETLASNENQENHFLAKWIEKYGFLIVLLFASSPLPDTPIILLAGALRLQLWKLIAAQAVGKTTLYTLGAALGGLIFMELKSITEEMIASTVILVLSVALCILVSWSRGRERILNILDKVTKKVTRLWIKLLRACFI